MLEIIDENFSQSWARRMMKTINSGAVGEGTTLSSTGPRDLLVFIFNEDDINKFNEALEDWQRKRSISEWNLVPLKTFYEEDPIYREERLKKGDSRLYPIEQLSDKIPQEMTLETSENIFDIAEIRLPKEYDN